MNGKGLNKIVSIFLMTFILTIFFSAMAFAGPIEQLEKHYKVDWDLVFQILGGPMGFIAIIITLIGVVVIIIVIGAAAWKALMLALGKGKFGKEEIKRFGTALIIALLITGGGIFSILKFVDNNIVDPGVKTTTGAGETKDND
ncbi:MAG: hypothetical protein N4A68_11820 [Maledivibacter sp.]|nr:hypothetical protein [Maledivibacter sp.]